MNLTESHQHKVCATNPCHFRERLREGREKETEKESAPHMEFIPNYLKICLKVIKKSVPFGGVCHASWKSMV